MKALKKVLALCLAAMLLLVMCQTAFADGNASITINGAVAGAKYNAYKIFDVATQEINNETVYAYTVTTDWRSFFEDTQPGSTYLKLNASGNPIVVGDLDTNDAAKAAFAKAAINWAKTNNLLATATATANENKTAKFSGLEPGYYAIDTTMGTLCFLQTTSVTVTEKNEVPSFKKEVSADNATFGPSSTAKIGDKVYFKCTFTTGKGNDFAYYFKDTMSKGLTYQGDIKVLKDNQEVTAEGNYSVVAATTDSNTGETNFGINFNQSFIEGCAGKDILITYSAILNKDAVISDGTNPNDATLTYNEKPLTGYTTTDTYAFDLVKYYQAADGNHLLAGAKFKLYDSETGGTEIPLVKEGDVHRPKLENETAVEITTTADKPITIQGLDKKIYWLEETEAPSKYNKLDKRVRVDLSNGNLKATTAYLTDNSGVGVENKSGTLLPSTGGIGTTIFYVVGGILMAGAVVLLVSKKRMEKDA